ncbi:MAG: hypothetical protein E7055_19065 [Lentisphaerae bacterium]|nr:hypothetical protein [Lentisphaerota bacterium]
MIIECPHCRRQFEVDDQISGQQISCPNCQKEFVAVNSRLFPCPDCCSLISKRAAVCPKCGAPLSTGVKNANSEETNWNDLSAERKIETYHPSPMNYLWSIILGIILLPAVVGLIILLFILIEIKCTSYELTSHRIIIRRGWISKVQNEIWIKDMRAVNLVQSIWQRIIGVGDIAIGTAASAGTEINIVGIANPADVVDQINSLRHS